MAISIRLEERRAVMLRIIKLTVKKTYKKISNLKGVKIIDLKGVKIDDLKT